MERVYVDLRPSDNCWRLRNNRRSLSHSVSAGNASSAPSPSPANSIKDSMDFLQTHWICWRGMKLIRNVVLQTNFCIFVLFLHMFVFLVLFFIFLLIFVFFIFLLFCIFIYYQCVIDFNRLKNITVMSALK